MSNVIDIKTAQNKRKILTFGPEGEENQEEVAAFVAGCIKDDPAEFELNFTWKNLTSNVLRYFASKEREHIAQNIVKINQLSNAPAALLPDLIHILRKGTYTHKRLPEAPVTFLSEDTSENTEENSPNATDPDSTLNSVKKELLNYLSYHHYIKSTGYASITLNSLIIALLLIINGACLIVTAGIHAPILAFIAALTTFVGGAPGFNIIAFAFMGFTSLLFRAAQQYFLHEQDKIKTTISLIKNELPSEEQPDLNYSLEVERAYQQRNKIKIAKIKETNKSDSANELQLPASILAEYIKDDSFLFKIDFSNINLETQTLAILAETKKVPKKILSLDIRSNQLDEKATPHIISILLKSTKANLKLPQMAWEENPYDFGKDSEIQNAQKSLKSFITHHFVSKYTQHIRNFLVALIIAAALVVNAACFAMASGIQIPLFAVIAAISTFIGGPTGIILIAVTAISSLFMISTAFQALILESWKCHIDNKLSQIEENNNKQLQVNKRALSRSGGATENQPTNRGGQTATRTLSLPPQSSNRYRFHQEEHTSDHTQNENQAITPPH